jgi:RNA polymerase sigma factor FliA
MMEATLQVALDPTFHANGHLALEKAFRDCEVRQGRPATNLEVCDELGLSLRELYALLDLYRGIGMGGVDDFVPVSVDGDLGALVKYVPNPSQAEIFHIVSKNDFRIAMVQAIEDLPKNEKLVVSLYHNEDLTMQEISQIFGISEMRVAQIHTTAMLRIRGKLQSLNEAAPPGSESPHC